MVALRERDDELIPSQLLSVWKVTRQLKKEQLSLYNCINSIVSDQGFVAEIRALYPQLPLLANLRCGLWYTQQPDGTCYFKSTDGHNNNWSFSCTRLNWHVCELAAQAGGVLIVDATRKGKRFPDAMTKTIPIWAAVVNRAVARKRAELVARQAQLRQAASPTSAQPIPPSSSQLTAASAVATQCENDTDCDEGCESETPTPQGGCARVGSFNMWLNPATAAILRKELSACGSEAPHRLAVSQGPAGQGSAEQEEEEEEVEQADLTAWGADTPFGAQRGAGPTASAAAVLPQPDSGTLDALVAEPSLEDLLVLQPEPCSRSAAAAPGPDSLDFNACSADDANLEGQEDHTAEPIMHLPSPQRQSPFPAGGAKHGCAGGGHAAAALARASAPEVFHLGGSRSESCVTHITALAGHEADECAECGGPGSCCGAGSCGSSRSSSGELDGDAPGGQDAPPPRASHWQQCASGRRGCCHLLASLSAPDLSGEPQRAGDGFGPGAARSRASQCDASAFAFDAWVPPCPCAPPIPCAPPCDGCEGCRPDSDIRRAGDSGGGCAAPATTCSAAPPPPCAAGPCEIEWDCGLHLPLWISAHERTQIEARLDGWVEGLLRLEAAGGADVEGLARTLHKPLRPLWISQASTIWVDSVAPPDSLPFTPLYLVSASQANSFTRKAASAAAAADGEDDGNGGSAWTYMYVPGAGDDEESWAAGLTPSVFWAHYPALLRAGPGGVLDAVARVLQEEAAALAETGANSTTAAHSATHGSVGAAPAKLAAALSYTAPVDEHHQLPAGCRGMAATQGSAAARPGDTWYFLGRLGVALGDLSAGAAPRVWQHFDAVLSCGPQAHPGMDGEPRWEPVVAGACEDGWQEGCSEEDGSACVGDDDERPLPRYAHLPVLPHKHGRTSLADHLGAALRFLSHHLQRGRTVLLHDTAGVDTCVCVAVALLLACYSPGSEPGPAGGAGGPVWAGPYRPGRGAGGGAVSKEGVRQRLAWVCGCYPPARPTRGMLRQVFNHFHAGGAE